MKARLDELIDQLSNPAIYPSKPDKVTVIQTHISVVFIAGELVYKIKKPLNLGFLDFTSLEKRIYYCKREVELNSRFSEGIYIDVVSINRDHQGLNLTRSGPQIDAAVLMRRIPQENLLVSMLMNARITRRILDQVVETIARIHLRAAGGTHIRSFGSPELVYRNIKENIDQTTPFINRTISHELHSKIAELSMDFIDKHKQVFRKRMAEDHIRDCHGDLHLDHVVILNKIMLIDCIEFNNRFRYGDTASDIAFLLMDLDFNGFPAISDYLTDKYAQFAGDAGCLPLLPFYKSYRAFVRGKVKSFALDEPEAPPEMKAAAKIKAGEYFLLSASYLTNCRPPTLIITFGLSGSGKSFVSSHLQQRLNISRLLSDVVRKQLYNNDTTHDDLDIFTNQVYTSSARDSVYSAIFQQADNLLAEGKSVILDATFGSYSHREAARNIARRRDARFVIVECTASDSTIRERLAQRSELKDDPSDAGWDVYLKQKNSFDYLRETERNATWSYKSGEDLNALLRSIALHVLTSHYDRPQS